MGIVATGPVRFFSASGSEIEQVAKPDDSIFASADYFKDVKPDEVAEADNANPEPGAENEEAKNENQA